MLLWFADGGALPRLGAIAQAAQLTTFGVEVRSDLTALEACDLGDRLLQWVRCGGAGALSGIPALVAIGGSGGGAELASDLAARAETRGEFEVALLATTGPARADLKQTHVLSEALPFTTEDASDLGIRLRLALDAIASERVGGAAPPARRPAIDVASRLEPPTVGMLDRLARWDTTSVDTIRQTYATVRPAAVAPDPQVLRRDAVIAGTNGRRDVAVRWYLPVDAPEGAPALVYFHGGAYIMGSLDENDDRLDRIALQLGCAIVSVDYRLAPEHPYPEGLDDAETVWRRVNEDAAALGLDPDRLAVGGASAGAGLAAALCLRLKEQGESQPLFQLLVYPMLDDTETAPSIAALAGGPGHWGLWQLRAERLAWAAYHRGLTGEIPPTAAPARAADLRGLAPAFLGIGDADALLDTNLEYASLLARSGVQVELHVYPGVIHGGWVARPYSPGTQRFFDDVVAALGRAFGSYPHPRADQPHESEEAR